MTPPSPSAIALELLKGVRRWAYARVTLRRLLDSKKATPEQVEKAQSDYRKLSDALEAAVVVFERALKATGGKIVPKKQSTPLPWGSILGAISEGAKALETALGHVPATKTSSDNFVRAEVIDMKESKEP